MKKGQEIILLVVIVFLAFCSPVEKNRTSKKKNIDEYFKKFITIDTLESVGFEHINIHDFSMLFYKEYLYILNQGDFMVAKFKGNTPLKVYKAKKGQAPKEFIDPRHLVLYDPGTIGVYDVTKLSVLLFDLDLDYLREIRVKNYFLDLARTGQGLTARQFTIETENVFAFLDENLNIMETFLKANNKRPFKNFNLLQVNHGHFLDQRLAAYTYAKYPYKNCNIDIYDLETRKMLLTLKWDQSHSPTQADIDTGRNNYYSWYAGKHGRYFVLQNTFYKDLQDKDPIKEMLIFDEKGTLILRKNFPHMLLRFKKIQNDSVLYFLDENEDISLIDIKDILE
jgi:hypothetical protein